eukprot:9126094-Pyramimonas_sp.AAC.1
MARTCGTHVHQRFRPTPVSTVPKLRAYLCFCRFHMMESGYLMKGLREQCANLEVANRLTRA